MKKNHKIKFHSFVMLAAWSIIIALPSCYTKKPVVIEQRTLHNQSKIVTAGWNKKQTFMAKVVPWLIGAGAVAAYKVSAEQLEYTPNGYIYVGTFLGGYYLSRTIINSTSKSLYKHRQQRKWIRKYNRSNGENWVAYNKPVVNDKPTDPFGKTITLVPRNNIEAFKQKEINLFTTDIEIINHINDVKAHPFNFFTWAAEVSFAKTIYPSFIIMNASSSSNNENLKNWASCIAIKYDFNEDLMGDSVIINYEIETDGDEYFKKTEGSFTLIEGVGRKYFLPIRWDYGKIGRNQSQIPMNIVIRLKDKNGNSSGPVIEHLNIMPVNSCIFKIGNNIYNHQFAGFVQEDNLEIEKIKTEGYKYISSWQGWPLFADISKNDPDRVRKENEANLKQTKVVLEQVYAVWRVLRDRKLKYNNDIRPEHIGDVFSQRVRLFNDALRDTGANCIDGTVLFASILQHLSINPYIVRVPGHAFLGFRVNNRGDRYFLETTLIGTNLNNIPLNDVPKYLKAIDIVDLEAEKISEDQFFKYALKYGLDEFNENNDNPNGYLEMVDINEVRSRKDDPVKAINY